ncbi:MAG: ABC transporter substrate-binding protein, partial [Desulfurococcaceae archaeon]|nr:ABC transporter substrate-binding protein [Desulfurococcaceae archaeon]
LANLTPVRGVTLRILTRHESSIQTLTRTRFLDSPVAKALGITEVYFIQVSAETWPQYIEDAKKMGAPIDIAWGGGPTLFNLLDEMGYLMPIDPTSKPEHYAIIYELGKIPDRIAGAETYKRDQEGRIRWIGASVSSFGFTINKLRISQFGVPEPRSWEDLTRPEYAKYLPEIPLLGTADPQQSTSNLRIFEIILQAKGWNEGWKILTLLAANAIIYSESGAVRDAVTRGDIAIGTTIDFYGYMAMHVNPNCQYIAPEGETIVNSDPIAILKDTRYPVHAAAFVAWVLSEYGGQLVWLNEEINRIPINPSTFNTTEGAQRPDLKAAFESLLSTRGIEFNETLSVNWVNSVIYYFKATLINTHYDLQVVWALVAKAYLDGKISREQFEYLVNELTKPVRFKDPISGNTVEFTLDYAISVNKKLREDPSVYNALMRAWESAAREKYLYVSNLLQAALGGVTTSTETPTVTPTTPTPTGAISPTLMILVVVVVVVIIAMIVTALARRE